MPMSTVSRLAAFRPIAQHMIEFDPILAVRHALPASAGPLRSTRPILRPPLFRPLASIVLVQLVFFVLHHLDVFMLLYSELDYCSREHRDGHTMLPRKVSPIRESTSDHLAETTELARQPSLETRLPFSGVPGFLDLAVDDHEVDSVPLDIPRNFRAKESLPFLTQCAGIEATEGGSVRVNRAAAQKALRDKFFRTDIHLAPLSAFLGGFVWLAAALGRGPHAFDSGPSAAAHVRPDSFGCRHAILKQQQFCA